MLYRVARLAIVAPRRTLTIAVLLLMAAGIFGIPVAKSLSAGGFQDPSSESARAATILTEKFGQGDVQLLFVVSAPDGVASAAARAVGTEISDQLSRSAHVTSVTSAWTAPPAAAASMISRDGRAGLIVAGISGGESNSQRYATALSEQIAHDRNGVSVRAGGIAMVNAQITEQAQRDVLVMEAIAIPLSFLVLVWVFGGLFTAALPVAIGGMSILGALAVLRLIAFTTDVSIFALNLSTALGLALAIDYTLLIVSRFRDEMAAGASRDDALVHTMATAGRTVLFSATTVALSMAAMILFPMHFLKSFAYAGIATVAFTAIAAVVMTPAAIVLLGDRLNALDVRRLVRRMRGRPGPVSIPGHDEFWYRSTKFVIRHALPVGVAVVVLLLLVGTPFLGVRWGFPDDRVLPNTASARQVGDQMRRDFADDSATAVSVVIPDVDGVPRDEIARYAADLSRVPDVSAVSAPVGTFVAGALVGPPTAPTGQAKGSAFLTVRTTAPLFSDSSETQLRRLHRVASPAARTVEFAGIAQTNSDSVNAITSHLPLVLTLIAAVTFVLLFLLTGSVVLPLKALVLNVLSLTTAFGAMVWIFQDHHLGGLGTTSTGTLVANMPVLLFCIAFGLSMDYEVFVVSRIREFWLASGPTRADHDESVALGIARTGRVVTAAALVMSISFAALVAAHVSFMRMFGVGLTLAVIADSTLVRMVLLPAFMHALGTWCWWAPRWLVRLHGRFGISEGHTAQISEAAMAPAPHAVQER
ncbi:MMPL family transporter [Mycobacterium sp. Aquia_216]|uniref:MMPL family transporter n=1 Tax=Mycobacterium sp. Aquia_216 TaxID=2991729 RepID=UPI00227CB20D|nr:MMPL family transporter [Mycobacterium sp. Aquia_216]WAJ47617.1 MMPL family transporter [Mycobacterium sp. Aquia_216]